MTTHTVRFTLKGPDELGEMADALDLSDETRHKFLEFGEYATIEIEVDGEMKIVGGRFVPVRR